MKNSSKKHDINFRPPMHIIDNESFTPLCSQTENPSFFYVVVMISVNFVVLFINEQLYKYCQTADCVDFDISKNADLRKFVVIAFFAFKKILRTSLRHSKFSEFNYFLPSVEISLEVF